MAEPGWPGALEQLRRARTPRGRASLGAYLIEGLRLHVRAVRAGAGVTLVVHDPVWAEADPRAAPLLRALRVRGCRVEAAPATAVAELTGGRSSGPILGLVRFPAEPTVEDMLAADERGTLLIAVDVEDPGNVGALTRTALALGAAGLVAVGNTDPFHPKSARTSMGSVFRLPIRREADVEAVLRRLGAAGCRLWAAVSREGRPADRCGLGGGPSALILGNEAFGLPDAVLSRVEGRLTIPMSAPMDSLSVNAAAAILLWELRQRSESPR